MNQAVFLQLLEMKWLPEIKGFLNTRVVFTQPVLKLSPRVRKNALVVEKLQNGNYKGTSSGSIVDLSGTRKCGP